MLASIADVKYWNDDTHENNRPSNTYLLCFPRNNTSDFTESTSGQSHCSIAPSLFQTFSPIEGWQAPCCTTVRKKMTVGGRERCKRETCRGFSKGSRLSEGGRFRRSWRSLPSIPVVRKMLRASAMVGRTRIYQKIPLDSTFL